MSDEAALLRAIEAEPDEDTPRLVYADWLDEHDQPERAEFIRLQIERARATLAGIPVGRSSAQKKKAKPSARENALLERHAEEWFQPPAGWKPGEQFQVRRGFPDAVSCNAQEFRDHHASLARWPIVRLSPGFYWGDTERARLLAEAPLLARVRELNMYYSHAGPDVLRVLLESPALKGLLWLDVGCNRLGDDGARLLAQRPCLPRLRYLDLRHNNITQDGVRALIGSAHRGAIEALGLCGNRVTVDDVIALLSSEHWQNLTDLDLWKTELGDDGVARLAAHPTLSRLTALGLNLNNITDDGVRALAASPHARNLRTLSLATNKLTSAASDVLMSSPHLGNLKYLRLTNNNIHWTKRRKLEAHFGPGVSFELM